MCQAWEHYHIKLLPGRYTSLRPEGVGPHVRIALVDPPDKLVEPLRRIRGLLEAQNTARLGPNRPDAGVATEALPLGRIKRIRDNGPMSRLLGASLQPVL